MFSTQKVKKNFTIWEYRSLKRNGNSLDSRASLHKVASKGYMFSKYWGPFFYPKKGSENNTKSEGP